ncbi:MAG: hypothetical protein EOP68_06545 [Sphingomonas sp.]|nr:MAG: hypothetical protein EOP68_06545 [Sphingomonas sp.]
MNDRPEPPRPAFATVPGDDYGMTYYDVPLPDDAPAAPGFSTFVPGGDPLHDDGPHVSRRQDGWSAANQRSFLEALAEGHGVDAAARRVGLSAASAYAFRRTAKGAAPHADAKAAGLVAQEFEAYLDLVGQDAGPARAGLFLARRSAALEPGQGGAPDLAPIYALAAADRFVRTGVGTAAEVEVGDLDPAARAGWTAEQWARAEAAGLIAIAAPADPADETGLASQLSQHSPEEEDPALWHSAEARAWRTRFPPPAGFDGFEEGDFGDFHYQRELDAYEQGCVDDAEAFDLANRRRVEGAERDRYFAAIRAEVYGESAGGEGGADRSGDAEHPPAETVEDPQQPGSDDDQSAPPA